MISSTEATGQARRMAQLDKYPFTPEAESELVISIAESANNLDHCRAVIGDIMRRSTICPKPAEIRSIFRPLVEDFNTETRPCSLAICDGSGFIPEYFLVTQDKHYKHRERVGFEQYRELNGKVDWKRQETYEAVRRCQCHPVRTKESGQ